MRDENKEVGKVSWNVYYKYIVYNGGYYFLFAIMLVMLLWQGLKGLSDIWILHWQQNNTPDNQWTNLFIYGGLAITSSIFAFVRVYILTQGSLKNSKRLHDEMVTNVVNAPINLFHDTVHKGVLLNRLSKDMEEIDIDTLFIAGTLVWSLYSFLGIITICSIYSHFSILFLPVLIIPGYLLTKFYTHCSREVTRLNGVTRSPLINQLAETVSGAITIRAFEYSKIYLEKFHKRVDLCFQVNVYKSGASNWFGLCMSLISLLFLAFLLALTSILNDQFTQGAISIMLTYTMNLQEMLFELLTCTSSLENVMVSMERCLDLTEVISEKPLQLPEDKELEDWPKHGKIKFANYSVKYRPNTETVLKNLDLEIEGGTRIGVVGRTGSGKSTLCLSLFRMLEPLEGTIYIDDIDICNVGLHRLRSSLTIIPQDPSLMKGTLRQNIDPLNQFTQDKILEVVKKVGLIYLAERSEQILDQEISESGSNLSVGEKQLICICRALLRVSTIIFKKEFKNHCHG